MGPALERWGDATNTWIYNAEQNAVWTMGDIQIALRIQRCQRERDCNFKAMCLKKALCEGNTIVTLNVTM